MKTLLLLLLLLCSEGWGQNLWSNILDPARAVDWTTAGVAGGIPSANYTQCGSLISSYTGTAAAINTVLAGCSANQFVLLAAGTFNLSTCIAFVGQSNVVLRGSGSGNTGTILIFTANTCSPGSYGGNLSNYHIVAVSTDVSNKFAPANIASWTATSSGGTGTYTKGDTSITLSALTTGSNAPAIGNILVLDQLDDSADPGWQYIGCECGTGGACTGGGDSSPACYSGAGPGGYTRGHGVFGATRGQSQDVTVTSVSGSGPYTVGISPGIYASNWDGGASGLLNKQPQAWWAHSPAKSIGVENLQIQPYIQSNGAIFWQNCWGCWVKGITVNGTGHGTAYPGTNFDGWGAVHIEVSAHGEVRDSYFYGNQNTTGSDTYVVALNGASDFKEENNIIQMPGSTLFTSADCEGCVSGYNFGVNPSYVSANAWNNGNQDTHAFIQFLLSEGNIGVSLYADSFHGTHMLNTFFRNRMSGRQQNCNGSGAGVPSPVPPGCTVQTGHTAASNVNPGSRYFNFIGNVVGTPSYHTIYVSTPSSHVNEDKSIWNLGWYSEGDPNSDSLVQQTALFWGNYDTVTAAAFPATPVRWCGNSSDTGWLTACGSSTEIPSSGLPHSNTYSNAVPTIGDTVAGQAPLPPSFYTAKPSWWPSANPWPPIGPDVTGGNEGQCTGGTYLSSEATNSSQCTGSGAGFVSSGLGRVYSLPAMDCYFNVMGGNPNGLSTALSFDASLCYSAVVVPNIWPSGVILAFAPGELTEHLNPVGAQ